MTIGEKIKFSRIERGLSQKQLATSIGVDVSFICKIEKNEKYFTIEKLEIISKILNIDLIELKILYYSNKIDQLLINEDDYFINKFYLSLKIKK